MFKFFFIALGLSSMSFATTMIHVEPEKDLLQEIVETPQYIKSNIQPTLSAKEEILPKFEMDKETTDKKEGFSLKIPLLSLDKPPVLDDEREAVQLSHEKLWRNQAGRNGVAEKFDPTNPDSFKVTIEAELVF